MSDSVRPHRSQPTRLRRPWDSPGKNTGVGCHFLLQCMKVKNESEVIQLCPTLSNPMDCSSPGSSVHGIFQARVLEWGAIAFSGWLLSHVQLYVTPWTVAHQAPLSTGFSSKNARRSCHFLLQGIFLTQGSNPGLPLCKQILYHLSHRKAHTCLGNPKDRGTWWAAVYRVAESDMTEDTLMHIK